MQGSFVSRAFSNRNVQRTTRKTHYISLIDIYYNMVYNDLASRWEVSFTNRAVKKFGLLPLTVKQTLAGLMKEMEISGPVRGNWINYSKLGKDIHHCHLKRGRPTYVCCWREGALRSIEVFFVGTHEDAPY